MVQVAAWPNRIGMRVKGPRNHHASPYSVPHNNAQKETRELIRKRIGQYDAAQDSRQQADKATPHICIHVLTLRQHSLARY